MAFPRLIRQSKGLQKIPNPKDFALEDTVNNIFNRSIGARTDFVEEGNYTNYTNEYTDEEDDNRNDGSRVLSYAKQIIEHPETDIGIINSRQQILQSFMAHPNLTNLVLNKTIPKSFKISDNYSTSLENLFYHRTERAESYLDFVTKLSAELSKSENPELEAFRNYVNALVTEGERLESLQQALGDIQKPAKLELKTKFSARQNSWDRNRIYYEMDLASLQGTFDSGKKSTTTDRSSRWNSELDIPYEHLFASTIEQVKQKGGRNLVAWEAPTELEVSVDEERGTVTGKAAYQKLDWIKTLLSFKIKTKSVVTPLELTPELAPASFSRAIKYLKNKEYSDFLAGYNEDISEFASTVVELRYLALAADYFNKLSEQGIPITMPAIVESDDKRMILRNLIEPNLVQKVALGDIVANDVNADASENMYVITGPNNNGKTTYMDALGIAQAMGQAGLMVLASEATISPRDNIFTHCIRPGDLVVGESRYAHELSRIKEIVKKATGNSLILMDEPCSGTSPEDGKLEADAVIRTIGELGATMYVATHFHNLIDTANELPYGRNLFCVTTSNGDDLVYTYKIKEGSSNQSNGTYLARKMSADRDGLRAILTERAEEGLQLRKK